MGDYKCNYCDKSFETRQQLGGHSTMCKLHPKYKPNRQKTYKKTFKFKCEKCDTPYELELTDHIFEIGKYRKNCSRKCANSKSHSKETKEKISNSVAAYFERTSGVRPKTKHKLKKQKIVCNTSIIIKCKQCNGLIETRFSNKHNKPIKTFCDNKCSGKYNFNLSTPPIERLREYGRLGGIKSAQIQSETRRSKNEIHFANLCKKRFKTVLTNEPMFNGWDADVILPNEKIAILWNGKWHYEKITEEHSVKQVQNRDKIKIKEIKKLGYIPYIIKDMGKVNPEFVKGEFDKFIRTLTQLRQLDTISY